MMNQESDFFGENVCISQAINVFQFRQQVTLHFVYHHLTNNKIKFHNNYFQICQKF